MKKYIEMILDYNYWANRRLLAKAASLSQAQLSEQTPYMWKSIMDTLVHVLGAEWIWRQRAQEGVSPAALLQGDQLDTLEALQQRWAEEEAAMRAYLDSLIDADFNRVIQYKNPAGESFDRPLWQIMAHVVNHGTQHRAEVALYLTNFDCSPGNMDISVYLTEQDD